MIFLFLFFSHAILIAESIVDEKGEGMRFFHLSDLHIGLKLMNHDLSEDQEHILAEIVRLAGEDNHFPFPW